MEKRWHVEPTCQWLSRHATHPDWLSGVALPAPRAHGQKATFRPGRSEAPRSERHAVTRGKCVAVCSPHHRSSSGHCRSHRFRSPHRSPESAPSPTCSSGECRHRGFGSPQAGLCTSSPCAARRRQASPCCRSHAAPWPALLPPPPCKRRAKSVHARWPLREASPARPCATMQSTVRPWATRTLCKPAPSLLCHWVASRIRPSGLCFFLFSEYIQIIVKFKILYKFDLNSEKCEINFLE
jgi:hypothetical protein